MNYKKHTFLFKRAWLLVGMISFLITQPVMASPEQERVYLLQLLHQIDAMQFTVLAAEKEQSKTARIQFHYSAYRDAAGQRHNGVKEDLQLIRAGIAAQLEHSEIEPRGVPPLSGDYQAENQESDTP